MKLILLATSSLVDFLCFWQVFSIKQVPSQALFPCVEVYSVVGFRRERIRFSVKPTCFYMHKSVMLLCSVSRIDSWEVTKIFSSCVWLNSWYKCKISLLYWTAQLLTSHNQMTLSTGSCCICKLPRKSACVIFLVSLFKYDCTVTIILLLVSVPPSFSAPNSISP